ncbi:MAG: site-specific integrase, partial [Oxalobacter sp.]|nr:site-specific integrase [Oxalobacter sp.]
MTQQDKGPPSLEEQVIDIIEGKGLAVHTVNTYCRQLRFFVRYCREHHQCTTLEACRPFADEWLMSRSHLSSFTLALDAASLARLYDTTISDFQVPGKRRRADITRSRKKSTRDRFFSEARNSGFVDFCRGTGLTRRELKGLKGDQLRIEGGNVYIEMPARHHNCVRKVPVIGNVDLIVKMMQKAGTGKVFRKIFVAADIQ